VQSKGKRDPCLLDIANAFDKGQPLYNHIYKQIAASLSQANLIQHFVAVKHGTAVYGFLTCWYFKTNTNLLY